MYDWLTDALADDSSRVITANRRLARTLTEQYTRMQLGAGRATWRRPAIHSWGEWLAVLVDALRHADELPLRINAQQSRALWEHCLREDIDDPLLNIGGLARLCRDTWLRLHAYRVPLADCQRRASGQDQRIFARAAGRYARRLAASQWVDDGQLPDCLARLVAAGRIAVGGNISLAGFDRIAPQAAALLDACRDAGASVTIVAAGDPGAATLRRYENVDAELRAAGAWARRQLDRDPNLEIAVVVSNLEQDSERSARLLREGLTPGWQYGGDSCVSAVNVSYGRRLADYPAIHVALLALRWLHRDLRGAEVGELLRSRFLGAAAAFGRSRLEMQLRGWPDRRWSRGLLLRALAGREAHADAEDWLRRVARAGDILDAGPPERRPAEWAKCCNDILGALNWPGDGPLTSADFQLINRWGDLLNDFARLELVSPILRGPEAVLRLAQMAGETLFQAEAESAVVNVLGPLEAAGLEFDRLWVTGLAANDWPPAGRPLVLLSRDLQREHGMPDAEPADTADFARRVLQRLRRSGSEVVFSYPAMIGDAEQLPTAFLADLPVADGNGDPGWHANSLAGSPALVEKRDRVPPVGKEEAVGGGAATIDYQIRDPFSAFAFGRLGIRRMQEFRPGIAANIRGSLIHDALNRLYDGNPAHSEIAAWSERDIEQRIERAVSRAYTRHERFADSVLRQLLELEKRRSRLLLESVVAVDRSRDGFSIEGVERPAEFATDLIRLAIRCDRVDRQLGRLVVFDYKTGQPRRFLTGGEPSDMQLVVYASAMAEPVAGLGLFHVDSRDVSIDGVGPALTPIDEWDRALEGWQKTIRDAARKIAAGDVRLNVRQNSRDARPLDLLSRFAELRRES